MPVHGSPCDCAADRSAVCQSRRQNSGDFVQFSLTFCATLPRNPLTPLFFRQPGSLPNDVSTIDIDNVKFERIRGHEQRPTSTCGRWRRSPWQNSQANLNNSGVKWDGLHPYNAGSLLRSVDTAPNLGKGGSRDVDVSSARCCTRLSPTLRARPLGQSSVLRNLVASHSEVGTLFRWDSLSSFAQMQNKPKVPPQSLEREGGYDALIGSVTLTTEAARSDSCT